MNPNQAYSRIPRRNPSSAGRMVLLAATLLVASTRCVVHGFVLPFPQGARPLQPSARQAARMDDEGEPAVSMASTEAATTTSESTDRQELVDALFKGKSPSRTTDENLSLAERLDAFLDRPLFDPDAYDESDDSFAGKMAKFVRADYELFEAVFVACFFLILISITKDVLRAHMAASGVVAAGKLF